MVPAHLGTSFRLGELQAGQKGVCEGLRGKGDGGGGDAQWAVDMLSTMGTVSPTPHETGEQITWAGGAAAGL